MPDNHQRLDRIEAILERMAEENTVWQHNIRGAITVQQEQIAENSRQIAENSQQIAENSQQIAENSRQIAELTKNIAQHVTAIANI